MFVFVLTEVMYIIYFRILSQYDLMKKGEGNTTFERMKDFWMGLGLLIFTYFVLTFVKFFLLNVVVLNSNE